MNTRTIIDAESMNEALRLAEESTLRNNIVTVSAADATESLADALFAMADDTAEAPTHTEFWGGDSDPWRVHVRHKNPGHPYRWTVLEALNEEEEV